jgi:hypothetical protein
MSRSVRPPRYDAEDLRESQARDQECLVLFEKHPHMDAYKYGGSFTPYAIVGADKRFSDGELAAEWWHAKERCMFVSALTGFGISSDSKTAKQAEVIHRFATLPNYDE